MASTPWDGKEIRLTIDAYFSMLRMELAGESFRKLPVKEELARQIGRSPGAVEYKFRNVSAALRDLRAPYVDGYTPLSHIQKALGEAVLERWEESDLIRDLAIVSLEEAVRAVPELGLDKVDPKVPAILMEEGLWSRLKTAKKVDFVELDARNRALGLAGEASVVSFEQRRLARLDRPDLAERVEHVSRTRGDGLGFDIASFEADGRERLIEVKTTRLGRDWPFYVSRNEVEVSLDRSDSFQLYRLYRFGAGNQRLYTLPGSLRDTCSLDAISYQALPRASA